MRPLCFFVKENVSLSQAESEISEKIGECMKYSVLRTVPWRKRGPTGRGTKAPPLFFKAQAAHPLPAPFNFPTPFCKACYQRIAGFAEWCFFFCGRTTEYFIRRIIFNIFSVFHKKGTAFLDRIRGPPSEI